MVEAEPDGDDVEAEPDDDAFDEELPPSRLRARLVWTLVIALLLTVAVAVAIAVGSDDDAASTGAGTPSVAGHGDHPVDLVDDGPTQEEAARSWRSPAAVAPAS